MAKTDKATEWHPPTHDQIARRAYEIYLSRGGHPGRDVDDWLQAEYELMQLPIRLIAELPTPPPPSPRESHKPARKSLVALVHSAML